MDRGELSLSLVAIRWHWIGRGIQSVSLLTRNNIGHSIDHGR